VSRPKFASGQPVMRGRAVAVSDARQFHQSSIPRKVIAGTKMLEVPSSPQRDFALMWACHSIVAPRTLIFVAS
jgi:hypothetical protein